MHIPPNGSSPSNALSATRATEPQPPLPGTPAAVEAANAANAEIFARKETAPDALFGYLPQPSTAGAPFDRTSPPPAGTTYVNPATGCLVVADPKPNDNTRISPIGNTYQVIGKAKVEEMKKDPHLALAMEGYEEAIANTSTTYADAQYRLREDVRAIRGSARGSNWNGESSEGGRRRRRRRRSLAPGIRSLGPTQATIPRSLPLCSPPRIGPQASPSMA